MKKKYYLFYLEIALNRVDDSNIYAFENVSHIPTNKLIELFDIDIQKDPLLLEGYFLSKTSHEKNRQYMKDEIGFLNLDMFEYCLRQYATDDIKQIRKLYKEDLME